VPPLSAYRKPRSNRLAQPGRVAQTLLLTASARAAQRVSTDRHMRARAGRPRARSRSFADGTRVALVRRQNPTITLLRPNDS